MLTIKNRTPEKTWGFMRHSTPKVFHSCCRDRVGLSSPSNFNTCFNEYVRFDKMFYGFNIL